MKIITVTRMPRKKKPHAPVDEDAMRIAARHFGRKGGQARSKKLTPRERTAAARHAARKRWGYRLQRLTEAAGRTTQENENEKGE